MGGRIFDGFHLDKIDRNTELCRLPRRLTSRKTRAVNGYFFIFCHALSIFLNNIFFIAAALRVANDLLFSLFLIELTAAIGAFFVNGHIP